LFGGLSNLVVATKGGVVVHAFKRFGKHFVYDTESGSLLETSKLFYLLCKAESAVGSAESAVGAESVLGGAESSKQKCAGVSQLEKEIAKFTASELEQARRDIETLKVGEILFVKPPDIKPQKLNRGLKAMCLHITHKCNLACKYCFAESGEGLYGAADECMSLAVGKRAIDFLIASSGARQNLEVDFFGGEPLLNFEVLKAIVYYARGLEGKHSKKFNFTLTTNALALDKKHFDFLNTEIFNVVISIDGRESVHNKVRNNSYKRVMDNAKAFVKARTSARVAIENGASGSGATKKGSSKNYASENSRGGIKSYYIRGTFTAENLDFANDVLHIYKQGFSNISLEPVVLKGGHRLEIKSEHLAQIDKEYERLGKAVAKINSEVSKGEISKKQTAENKALKNEAPKNANNKNQPLNFFHFNIDKFTGPCVEKRINACGAGTEYIAVTPNGDIYPCHQFAGFSEYLLGNVYDGLNKDKIYIGEKFLNTTVLDRLECEACFAKYHCSGGCFANSVVVNNNFYSVYRVGCEMFKSRLEVALALLSQKLM